VNIQKLKEQLEIVYGQEIKYVKDCDVLAGDMTLKTNRNISPSTLKRLLGFNKSSGKASLYTLDTIGKYLGFDSWQAFTQSQVKELGHSGEDAASLQMNHARKNNPLKRVLLLSSVVLVLIFICGYLYWFNTSNDFKELMNLPEPRNAGRAIIFGDSIYYVGGTDAEYVRNSTWLYDSKAEEWIEKSAMPTARGEFAASLVNDKIYCFGGWLGNNIGETDVAEIYDIGSDLWDSLPALPVKITSANAVTLGSEVYVLGGTTGATETHFIRFDTQKKTYEALPTPKTDRMYCAMVANNGLIYAIGGNSFWNGEYRWHNEFSCYNPSTRSWTELPPLPMPLTRSWAAVNGNFIHVAGGTDGHGHNNAAIKDCHFAYDLEAGEWFQKERLPYRISAHQLLFHKDKLMILGGISQFPNPLRKFVSLH
jgi:N-acetylneuraminic acid mutarotase